MRITGFSVVKAAGVVVVLMGVVALAVVAAPYVYGQSSTRRTPLTQEIRTHLIGGPYVGVTVRDADSADVERAKLPSASGAVVEEVRVDSPAAKAGVQAGDVITRFDGERVRSARHFDRLVTETPEGRAVEMTVVRAGENVNMTVTPEASPSPFALESLRGLRNFELRTIPELRNFELRMPEHFTVMAPRLEGDLFAHLLSSGRLGVGVQDLTDQLAEYFGAKEGVLVTSVEDDTPAKTAGLQAGDVITKVNGEAVRTSSELRRQLDRASGEVTITLIRERREQTVKAQIRETERRAPRRIVR
jgi:serine protease Do